MALSADVLPEHAPRHITLVQAFCQNGVLMRLYLLRENQVKIAVWVKHMLKFD